MAIATREPEKVRQGGTVQWTKSLADYLPEDGWILRYSLANSQDVIVITGSDNGDSTHLISVPTTTTSGWHAGEYQYTASVTKAAERFFVGQGRIEILPDLSLGAIDTRSHVKKTLDALEAMIENKASKDQISYEINGRKLSRFSPEELLMWYEKYKAFYANELREERINQGLGGGNKIKVRFV